MNAFSSSMPIKHNAASQRPILLVEDSPEDQVTTERVLREVGFVAPITICESGEQALEVLSATRNAHDLPGLVLLDLNMPGLDGRDLLRLLRSDDRFRALPVVVLTTSDNPRDVLQCYDDGCNSYLVKDLEFPQFKRVVRELLAYWFDTALLPGHVQ